MSGRSVWWLLVMCLCLLGCGKQRGQGPKQVAPTSRNGSPERIYESPGKDAPPGEPDSPAATADKWRTEADRHVVRSIRRAIMADDQLAPTGTNVLIDVEAGKVTLKGKVPSKQHRRAIAAMVEKHTGAQPAVNNLEVNTNSLSF